MAIVSTRPGIKVKTNVRFPASVSASSPLSVTQNGGSYAFAIDTSTFLTGGTCWVWQVKYGLIDYGVFATVESAISASTATRANIAWSQGARSQPGDTLANIIKSTLGWNDSQITSFYAYCSSLIL